MSAEVRWTDRQKQAIDDKGLGMIVSAAAGSGKTAVLIERMIRLLCDENERMPADRLLAVTFTKEAAAQMRDKLAEAFEKRLRLDPDNKWLLEQQNLLQLARISTINSFCLDLVRTNLDRLDFSGGLTILEENVQQLIYDSSKEQALRDLYERSPEDYELVMGAFGENGLSDVLDKFYSFIRTMPFRDEWLEKARANFTDKKVFDSLTAARFERCESAIQRASAALERFRSIAAYSDDYLILSDFAKLYDNAESDALLIKQLKRAVKDKDIDAIAALPIKLGPIKTPRKSKKLEVLDPAAKAVLDEKCELAKDERRIIKEALEEIHNSFSLTRRQLLENMQMSAELLDVLACICERIDELALEQKLDRNGITFSDAELLAKELLVKKENGKLIRTELAEQIRQDGIFGLIFIDEFQDVNNLQELVFRVLSDTDDLDIMGRNVFVVGDVKQAIYKFRLSNPDLFIKTLDDAGKEENKEQLEAVILNQNFRSRTEVISFVNFCFDALMSETCGGVLYNDDHALVKGADYDETAHPTKVLFIDNDPVFKKENSFSRENYECAKMIKEMLEKGEPVNDKGELRACRPGDFCILVQTNAEGRAASAALEAVGLKSYTKDTDGYLNSREIQLVVNILRVIDNPMKDIPMAAVMLSPIMGFDPDEAARVAEFATKGKKKRHFWQVLVASDESKRDADKKEAEFIDLGDEKLQQKCQEAFRLIDRLRTLSMNMSLEKFIGRVYDITDLMGITSLYLDADKKRANLRLLLQYAHSYEENSSEGVTGFIRYLDSVSKNEKAFSKAVTAVSGEGSVCVKTYHASKGLEYPFVFMTQLDREIESKTSNLITHNDLGCAFRFTSPDGIIKHHSLYYEQLKKTDANEAKSEAMRLMYVGCTRAREQLFICYAPSYKTNETFEAAVMKKCLLAESVGDSARLTQLVTDCKSMLDWLTVALMRQHDNSCLCGWLGAEGFSAERSRLRDPDIRFIDLSKESDKPEKLVQEERDEQHFDSRLLDELKKRADFEYKSPIGEGEAPPAKMTVTEIVASRNAEKYGEAPDLFFPNLLRLDETMDQLSAAERGTFTHKFMELADYKKASVSVSEELERLVREGFFTAREARGVYKDALEAFFRSDLCARIMASPEVLREKQFLVSYDDLDLGEEYSRYLGKGSMLQGIADCIFLEDDGYVLIDYKTDRFKDESEFEKYNEQLALYKAALDLILDKPVKECRICSLWLLRMKKT